MRNSGGGFDAFCSVNSRCILQSELGFAPDSVKSIKEAFRLIYRSKLNTRQGIEAVRKELPATGEINQILEFIEQTERGIIR